MKLASAKKVHYDSGPNMTPLVDVVMVILIFLMLTGTFAGATHYLKSNVPVISKGGAQVVDSKSTGDTLVEIRITGRDSLNVYVGSTQFTDQRQLAAALKAVRQNKLADGTKDDNIQAIIAPGAETNTQVLIQVFAATTAAEFKKIAFSSAR